MTELKHRVIIDVYPTEDGQSIFFIGQADHPTEKCPLCVASGIFVYTEEVEDWLIDYAGDVIVVEDHRDAL